MAFPQGHALLIGVGSHLFHGDADVPISVSDAQTVAEVLQDLNTCGYPPEQVQFLHDATATRAGILTALDTLADRAGPESTVFVFFCGHGTLGTDGNYHMVTHDAQFQRDRVLVRTGVSEGELLEKLRAIQAQRMLMIFNACYSGRISPTLSPQPATLQPTNPPEEATAALLGTGSGRIIITACREGQVSYIGRGTLSIFAQALVDGLRGRGVRNHQGYISAFSLYEQLYEQVREVVQTQIQAVQEPELTVLKGVGPFAVALYKGASSLGAFDPSEPLPQNDAVREVSQATSERFFSQRVVQTGGGAYVEGNMHVEGGNYRVGRDNIVYGDQVHGDKMGGDSIRVGDISGSQGIAIGRGAQAHVNQGLSGAELGHLFAPLLQQVRQTAPPERRQETVQKVQALQKEAAKGQQADDSRLAGLLEDLAALMPSAVSTVVSIFATPVLSGIAGNVTNYVLEKLRRQRQ